MIPTGSSIANAAVTEAEKPSKTWKLDCCKGRIKGQIDGLEAVKQAVFKILATDRYIHPIYSFNYGNELRGLIGKSPLFVKSEVSRIIREALTQDDRINSVENIETAVSGDSITVIFTVKSSYGTFEAIQEVG